MLRDPKARQRLLSLATSGERAHLYRDEEKGDEYEAIENYEQKRADGLLESPSVSDSARNIDMSQYGKKNEAYEKFMQYRKNYADRSKAKYADELRREERDSRVRADYQNRTQKPEAASRWESELHTEEDRQKSARANWQDRQYAEQLKNDTENRDSRVRANYQNRLEEDQKKKARAKEVADYNAYYEEKAEILGNMPDEQYDALSKYLVTKLDYDNRARDYTGVTSQDVENAKSAAIAAGVPEDKFDVYAQYVNEENNRLKTEEMTGKVTDALNSEDKNTRRAANAIGVTADVLSSPLHGMGIFENKNNYADQRAHKDTNSGLFMMQNLANAFEQEQKKNIAEYGAQKGWSETGTKIATGAYDIGMTTGKAAVNMMIGQAAGSAVAGSMGVAANSAKGAKIVKTVANLATLPSFGASSYTQTLKEGYERGLSESQAQKTALVAGTAEMLTEVVSLDLLLDTFNKGGKVAVKEIIGDVLKNSAVEGSEEAVNDIINNLADAAINGDLSKYNTRVAELMAGYTDEEGMIHRPMSEDEAKKQATKEQWVEGVKDFGMGMASGAILGGAAAVTGNISASKEAKQLFNDGNYRETAEAIDTDQKSYANEDEKRVAEKTKAKLEELAAKEESGEKVSANEKREAYQLLEETMSNAERFINDNPEKFTSETQNLENEQDMVAEDEVDIAQLSENIRKAETTEELVAAEREAKAAGLDEVQVDKLVGKIAESKGISEEEISRVKAIPTEEEAYEMGVRDEEAPDNLDLDGKVAFTEGKMKALADGIKKNSTSEPLNKSTATYNGKEITVEDILDEDTLITSEGEIPATKVKFKNEAAQFLYETALKYKGKVREDFLKYYPGNAMPAKLYADVFNSIYNAGSLNKKFATYAKNNIAAKMLDEEATRFIYDHALMENIESRIKNKTGRNAKLQSGSVKDLRVNKPEANDTLLHAAEMLSKKLGIDVVLGGKVSKLGNANGKFDGNTIYVKEGTGVELRTLYHEMGEFIKAYGDQKFNELRQSVIDWYSQYAEKGFDELVKDYYESYVNAYEDLNKEDHGDRSITMGEAADEVIFDALLNICMDEKVADNFIEWAYDTKGIQADNFVEKFRQFVKDFFEHLRDLIADQSKAQGEFIANRASVEELASIQKKVMDAIDAASKTYRKVALENANNDTESNQAAASYSINMPLSQQIEAAKRGELGENERIYMGETPQLYIDLGLPSFPMLYTQDHLKEALAPKDRKHKHGLKEKDIVAVPELIKKPAMIFDSAEKGDSLGVVTTRSDEEGYPIVVFIKPNSDGYIELELVNSNNITSIHGYEPRLKDGEIYGIDELIRDAIKLDNVLWVGKKEIQEINLAPGVRSDGIDLLDSDKILHKSRNVVNSIKNIDSKYFKAIKDGNLRLAGQYVRLMAKRNGYTIDAYHGTRNEIDRFSKEERGRNTGTELSKNWFFAGDVDTAKSYSPYHALKELAKQNGKKWVPKEHENVKGNLYHIAIKMNNPLEVNVKDYDFAAHRATNDALMEYARQAEENGNDGIIFYNVPDNNLKPGARESTVYLFKEPTQAKSLSPITYDENNNPIPLTKRFDERNEKINYSIEVNTNNIGFHAGDLGKAERYASQGKGRDTGHFGTGTYFVGNEEKLTGNYKDRPQHAVNFDDYNLYKISNNEEGYKLHRALRVIDGGIDPKFVNALENGQFSAIPVDDYFYSSYMPEDPSKWNDKEKIAALEKAAKKTDCKDFESFEEWSAHNDIDPEDAMYYYIDEMDDRIKENAQIVNEHYKEVRNAYDDLLFTAGRFNDSKLIKAIKEVVNYQENTSPNFDEMQDSLATVLMKSLGYEGVDTRNTGLDNTTYGSVIYDVKPQTVVYSLEVDTDGNKLSEGQKEYFKDTKAVDEDGALLKMYHGTVSDFTVFDRNYGSVEGDWGKGFYFTNKGQDADKNYANENGSDLTNKIERLAEELEWEEGFEDTEYEDRLEEAKKRLITGDAHTLSVYLNVTNPVYIREKNPTLLFDDLYEDLDIDDFEDEDDYYQAIDEALAEKYSYIENALMDEGYEDLSEIGDVLFQAAEEGGISAQDLKNKINEFYFEDGEGHLASNEITRIIIEAMGYDGIIDETVSTKFNMKLDPDTKHIIVFNSNQAKNTDNLDPTEDADIRYSIEVDTEGKKLSEGQQEYFKDSKAVDANGALKVMYHGSPNEFTVFDKKKAKGSGTFGSGFYFSDSDNHAGQYGKLLKVYLNITEPLTDNYTITEDQLRNFIQALADDEDYGIDNYGYGSTVDSVFDKVWGGSDFKMIMDLDSACVGNTVEALKLFNEVNGTNFDGIISDTEMVIFESNQAKNTDNLDPTENPDIRYSLDLPKYSNETDDLAFEFGMNDLGPLLQEGARLLEGQEVDRVSVDNIAKRIIKQNNSEYDPKTLADNLEKVFAYMQSKKDISYADLGDIMVEVARPIVEESRAIDPQQKETYDEFVSYLKSIGGVRLSDLQKGEVRNAYGTYGNYRNKLFGKLNISDNGNTTLDQIWSELREQSNFVLGEANEGDQPIKLLEALDAMKPSMINQYDENVDEAAYDVALQIVHAYYDTAGNSKEIQALKKDLRQKTRDFQNRVKEAYKKRYEEEVARSIAKGEKVSQAILKERARVRDIKAQQTERQEASHNRDTIRKTANQLFNMLEKPSDKRHIPDALRTPITEFLASMDFVSPRAKVDSKTALRWQDMMLKLATDLKEIEESGRLGDKEDRQIAYMKEIIDPDLYANLKDLVDRNKGLWKISNLSAKDLKTLSNCMTALKNACVKSNEGIGGTNIDELGRATLHELANRKERRDDLTKSDLVNRGISFAKNFFNLELLDSITYFEELGPTAKKILTGLQTGWKQKVQRVGEAQDWMEQMLEKEGINQKDLDKWKNSKQFRYTFTTDEGSIELSAAQIMELYAHSKREQSRDHYARGGIRSGARFARPTVIHVTPSLFSEMMSKLSDDQKKVVDRMQQYLSSTVAGWGNNVSKEAYGYSKFNEKNYWPIKTDSNTRAANDKSTSDNVSLNAIKNKGFSKNITPNANNAMIIGDLFDTFGNHVSEMAAYEGMLIPLSDAMRWYNYAEVVEDPSTDSMRFDYGVKQSIEKVLGRGGQQYFINFIKDINGEVSGDKAPEWITKMVGNSKAAAVSANARVIIQQPTAITRALNEMNGKYLMMAMPSLFRASKLARKAQDTSMLAKWKHWGYFDAYLGQSMSQVITGSSTVREKIQDVAAAGAQLGDDLTWGVLWQAVEYEIQDTTNLEKDSAEYNEAVAKRFDDIVDRTQVVDTVFNRSQLMRSNNDLVKLSTAFMMEPSKSYNMLHRAIASGNKGKMARAGVTYILNAMVVSAAAAIIDAFRADDDDTPWIERYINALIGMEDGEVTFKNALNSTLGGNINPLAQIPYAKEIFSAMEGYDASRMDVAWIYDLYDAAAETVKYAKGTSKKTALGVSEKIMKAAGESTGLPIYQAYREVKTFYNNITNIDALKQKGYRNLETKAPGEKDGLKRSIITGLNIADEVNNLMSKAKEEVDPNSKYYERELKDAMEKEKSSVGNTITSSFKEDYVALANDPESKDDFATLDANIRSAFAAAGFEEEEINEKLNLWINPKEDTTYLKWDLLDAVDSGKGIKEAVTALNEAGKDKGAINTVLTEEYREKYNELVRTNPSEARSLERSLRSAWTEAGYEDGDITDKLTIWGYGDGTSTSVYQAMHDAFEKGGGVQNEVKKLMDHNGKEKGTIAGEISDKYKAKYNELAKTPSKAEFKKLDKNIRAALEQAGYEQKDIDEKLSMWAYGDGTSTTIYQPLYDTFDKGGDVQSEVKKLMDSGKEKSQVASAITSHYKPILLETKDANLKNQLIKAYMAAGYTHDKANKKINDWFKPKKK